MYKVLWADWPPECATWESEDIIHDDYIEEYEAAMEAEAELDAEEAAEDEAGRTALELKRAEESSCVFDVDYVDEVRRDKIVAELAAAALARPRVQL